jgi:hypothetical protein
MSNNVYQLDPQSVSPYRLAGRDKDGVPREETICALAKSEYWVDKDGNTFQAPMQCGRVLSHEPEAERYEMIQKKDLIEGGALPLEMCPHTTQFAQWVSETGDGRLVPLPDGVENVNCRGKKRPADWPAGEDFFGCEHMEPIIKRRRATSRERWQKLQTINDSLTQEQVAQVASTIANAFAPVAGRKAVDK